MYDKETNSHRNRHRIVERVVNYPPETLPERLNELKSRIDMLHEQWANSPGDENVKQRRHLIDCITVAAFESSQIEKRINELENEYLNT